MRALMIARAGKEVGSWHETDMPTAVRDVRYQDAKGKTFAHSEFFSV
jgi:hypothetical protein